MGAINFSVFGEFGSGALGNRVLSGATARPNSFAKVSTIENNGYALTLTNVLAGSYGDFVAGQEVMFHVTNTTSAKEEHFGKFIITKIQSVNGSTVMLESPAPVTDITDLTCQLVSIPQFADLTITNQIQAEAWNASLGRGGMIIVKARGTLDMTQGGLISEGKGMATGTRPTAGNMDNYYLHERLPLNEGNGIVVVIAKNLILSATSRLGATWSGALGAGAAGAGGVGGYFRHINDSSPSLYVNGTAGAAGNAGAMTQSGKNGQSGTTGGNGGGYQLRVDDEGFYTATGGSGQLNNSGTNGTITCPSDYSAYGRDAAGGIGGAVGLGGATVLIVSNNISNWNLACLSTGGGGGAGGGLGTINNNGYYVISGGSAGGAGGSGGAGYSGGAGGGGGNIGGLRNNGIFSRGGGGGGAGGGAGYGMIVTTSLSDIPAAPYATAYGLVTDLITQAQSLHIANQSLDVRGECKGLLLDGIQPVGTNRRIAFNVEGTYYKLTVTNGVATPKALPSQSITANSILNEGNTISELSGITSIPAFDNKSVFVAVAMSASDEAAVPPTLKVGIKSKSIGTTLERVVESAVYEIDAEGTSIIKISTDAMVEGDSVVDVKIRLFNNGWSEYMALDDAIGLGATKVQIKVRLAVASIRDENRASVGQVRVEASKKISYVAGSKASICSKIQDFDIGMMCARLFIKHAKLVDADLKAYCMFVDVPLKREMYAIGTATGGRQVITLTDSDIDFTSLRLFSNADELFGFDYNSIENTVSFTAEQGATMYASYKYQVGPENWNEMVKGRTQPYSQNNGYASTEYSYIASGIEKTIGAVRIDLDKPAGTAVAEELGFGTGRTQVVFLKHYALEDTIKLYQGSELIAAKNWGYDMESKRITLVALKDRPITADYEWLAETPKISGYVAAWNQ